MAKPRGSKADFLNHIKKCLEEGLNKPELLTEYTRAVIKNIEEEIRKRGKSHENRASHKVKEVHVI
jgi:hypothetical protein